MIFREPIIISNVPDWCPAGRSRSSSVVTPSATSTATDFKVPGPGTLTMTYTPTDGSEPIEFDVYDFPGGGSPWGCTISTTRSVTSRGPRCATV